MALLVGCSIRARVRLPWFRAYLTLRLLQYAGLATLDFQSDLYRQWWFLSEAILLIALALATVEGYSVVTREIFGLGRIGRIVAFISIGLAAGTALATGADASVNWSARLAIAAQAKRALLTFLAVALIALTWFYHRFPVPVPSYVWPHMLILETYLASHAIGYWGIAVAGKDSADLIDQMLTVVWCGCLIAWLRLFDHPVQIPPSASAEDLSEANRRARQLERVVDR